MTHSQVALDQSLKKFRDVFAAGETSQILQVPAHKKGALIGKKGSNIEAIRSKSGAQAAWLQVLRRTKSRRESPAKDPIAEREGNQRPLYKLSELGWVCSTL